MTHLKARSARNAQNLERFVYTLYCDSNYRQGFYFVSFFWPLYSRIRQSVLYVDFVTVKNCYIIIINWYENISLLCIC